MQQSHMDGSGADLEDLRHQLWAAIWRIEVAVEQAKTLLLASSLASRADGSASSLGRDDANPWVPSDA